MQEHKDEFDIMWSAMEETSICIAYRMDFLENFKSKIIEMCYKHPVARILTDITRLFRPETYVYPDHVILFINTYKAVGTLPEWDEFLKTELKSMKLIFDGTLLSDPLIDENNLTVWFSET